ncbi:MAG: HPr(Ser) kinase/phosphatase [Lachnospiraceae bacterium]|nr:HPr(Ser) kinase/phosphatase [Lachnospiraceae bacterium]MDY5742450.1 HPr(Ser) kinase/phosphatase [Lachnospiraceae bacterium]
MGKVMLKQVVEKMDLEICTPDIPFDKIEITTPDLNRAALQLAGYFEHFDTDRIQIVGYVESTYLMHQSPEVCRANYERFLSSHIPCVIYTTETAPDEIMLELAHTYQVPILKTNQTTSDFVAELIRWLKVELAKSISIHGVLVEVYGEGVLIMGESGIGKSEAALELLKRGHRLITDDVVTIKRVSAETLVGYAPDVTKHFIELRGIGIVDVKTLFGVQSVKETSTINLVIKLEEWDKDKEYDRIGLKDEFTEILGNSIVCHSIPIRPGRNLAIIVETAAVNFRQKQMGYNAAEELYARVQASMRRSDD